MYDLGPNFKVDLNKSKTPTSYVFRGNKYRISIISNTLIRFEYSDTGSFNDYPTFFASNRSFGQPKLSVEEDNNKLIIKNDVFLLEYQKEKSFFGSKLFPNQNLNVKVLTTGKSWYFNHAEARNIGGTAYSLDDSVDKVKLQKGLFSLDGFSSFDDSRTPIIDANGNVLSPNYKNIDTYLFIYSGNFGVGLRDYFNLTSLPPLIPKYALGVWWAKDEVYREEEIPRLINDFKKNEIPISILLLGSYARTKNQNSDLSFTFNKTFFPEPTRITKYLHEHNIFFGINLKTEGILSLEEPGRAEFSKIYKTDTDKNIPINVYNSNLMDAFLKSMINPLLNNGVDFFWIDDDNRNNTLRNFTMNYFLFKNFAGVSNNRGFILSRNFGIVPHKYSLLYSGKTMIKWKTLEYLPQFNASASNIGISWWSHDIGGYKGGIEDSELYMRYVQLGTFSPILRLASESGKYYKREPWKWDAKTLKIVHDYLNLRHRLLPYLYSEAYKYSSFGSPLVQPLYYKYPDAFDEPLYKNEYYFGSELFVSPIVSKKDEIMNRVVHRILIPNGIWYDFKTGKKFVGGTGGGKRYVTFYKDEDYPVFAKTGAIIPLAVLNKENLNDISSPKSVEIHVFPGRSNTYKLYEDDGITNKYLQGESFITEINYYYKENDFSLTIQPQKGRAGVIPERRNYVVKFRNTKFAQDVKVIFNDKQEVKFASYVDDNDFVVEFNGIPTTGKVMVYCKGKNIEIDASRAINEDLESIITDLSIETELKVKIDKILFSDLPIKSKRIQIKKLKRDGLTDIHIKMFMKLLEYVAEV